METKDFDNFTSEGEVLENLSPEQPEAACSAVAEIADAFVGVELCADGETLEVSDVSQAIGLLQHCEDAGYVQLGRRSDGALVLSGDGGIAVKLSDRAQLDLTTKVAAVGENITEANKLIEKAQRGGDLELAQKAYVRLTAAMVALVALGVPADAFAEKSSDGMWGKASDGFGGIMDFGSALSQAFVMFGKTLMVLAPIYPFVKYKGTIGSIGRFVGQKLSNLAPQIEVDSDWVMDTLRAHVAQLKSPENPHGVIPKEYAFELGRMKKAAEELHNALNFNFSFLGNEPSLMNGLRGNEVYAKPVYLKVQMLKNCTRQIQALFGQVRTDTTNTPWTADQRKQFNQLMLRFDSVVRKLNSGNKPVFEGGAGRSVFALLLSFTLCAGSLQLCSAVQDSENERRVDEDDEEQEKSRYRRDKADDDNIFEGMKDELGDQLRK